jgi:hypothetical protein
MTGRLAQAMRPIGRRGLQNHPHSLLAGIETGPHRSRVGDNVYPVDKQGIEVAKTVWNQAASHNRR